MRKEYRPPDRRTAQQLKADKDFALRMQRQEQEIEKHQLAHFREAQRRQMTQFDMGGVPQQDQQVCASVSCGCLPCTVHIIFHGCHLTLRGLGCGLGCGTVAVLKMGCIVTSIDMCRAEN